ncbi:MAG: SLC45 family MFS transporter [Bacteroidaceae bacterium]
MKNKPDLNFWRLWNISFGFFGVQIAYALQSANISRIFATLGADPHNLSYFWILPPLAGLIIQPIIGEASDRTWTKLGRRIPYLLVGSIFAVIVLSLLPNAGSLNLSVAGGMVFGLFALMFLDTSINIAMQPFKMMVGDMVNEKQKGLAYSIQSFLVNVGSVIGFIFPFFFTWIGIQNVAPKGVVPPSVVYSFYFGAAILMACVIYTVIKVKEMPPKEFNEFHHITAKDSAKKEGLFRLLVKAPDTFWTVGLVQFFSWAAFMYMWTYITGATAENIWHSSDPNSSGYQEAANWAGILFAVEAIGAVLWAIVLPFFKNKKVGYSLSLFLGGIGFISTLWMTDQYTVFISYALVGCAWAAMMAMPFTIFTNSVSGKNMGAYLGLFNGTICVPQIVAALVGGTLFVWIGGPEKQQVMMLVVAGVLLLLGSLSVYFIKEKKTGDF